MNTIVSNNNIIAHSIEDIKKIELEILEKEILAIKPIDINYIPLDKKFAILKRFRLTGKPMYQFIQKEACVSYSTVRKVLKNVFNNPRVNRAFTKYFQEKLIDPRLPKT